MKKVAENEKSIFYEDSITKSLSKNDIGIKCYIVEEKKGGPRCYVLIKDNEYLHFSYSLEGIDLKLKMFERLEK